jgi:hypothetical protein
VRILLLLTAIGFCFTVNASESLEWNAGVLVTVDGKIQQGELAFQVSEIVLFRAAGEITVYPANKVHSFRYYDQTENINRKFVSRQAGYGRIASFYEVIVVGEVSVMRLLKSQRITNRKKSDRDDYDYFLLFEDHLINLNQFRNKVYPDLVSSSERIANLIKEQHLDPNQKADAIRIVQLYNKISYTETVVAGI